MRGAGKQRPGKGAERDPRYVLLSHLSDRLRTPLVAILGYADVLSEDDSAAFRELAVSGIRENGRKLLRILDELLDLAALREGSPPAQPTGTAPAERGRDAGHPPAARPVGLRGSVLIVDDSPDNRRLLGRIVERVGLDVQYAGDGHEALAAVRASPFDLILMDVQMPGLDGLSATRELRARGFERPIIGITANTAPGTREACFEAGCDEYLTKPVDRMHLLDTLEHLLA
jgi:CheY-like chemotaxis protein